MDNEPNNDSDLANEGVGEGDRGTSLGSQSRPRKRKRGRKGEKRQGIADKLQHSLDRILENMDQVSQTANDPFSMSRCLLTLKDVPGLVKGSSTYMMSNTSDTDSDNYENANRLYIMKKNALLATRVVAVAISNYRSLYVHKQKKRMGRRIEERK
ncbi:hypothetical protein K1719_040591 [Acacia pycnantha]|nr:hypothetical protein K1719_040591 [Acacia pycnantha]